MEKKNVLELYSVGLGSWFQTFLRLCVVQYYGRNSSLLDFGSFIGTSIINKFVGRRKKLYQVLLTKAHCSYLDIYISQNIRLCKGDFEGQFQTTL